MNRFLLIVFTVFSGVMCHSAPMVAEAPVSGYGTPVTISVSTGPAGAWTKVPTTQTTGRMGIILDIPASATGPLVGHLGNCTSTAVATTVRPIEIAKGSDYTYISMRDDVCLWMITLHTAAENIHVQEIKQ